MTNREKRYTEGYQKGLQTDVKWHPYMGWDHVWAQGYRDAQKTKKAWLNPQKHT